MTEIWLADLARACRAVNARTVDERRRVAALLGLAPDSLTVPRATAVASTAGPGGQEVESPPDDAEESDDDLQSAGPQAPPRSPHTTRTTDEWDVEPLALEPVAEAATSPRLPLIEPKEAATILRLAVRTNARHSGLDVPAVVARIAAAKPLEPLPSRPRPTVRFGVEVLVDIGTAMQPFARDHLDVVQVLNQIIGTSGVRVLYFDTCPDRGAGPGAAQTWQQYVPPPRGTPVLVLSDLGIGGFPFDHMRADSKEWRTFFVNARRAGARCVALVPYPPARWPHWVAGLAQLVQWDRGVTAVAATRRWRR
jgi:hypothetical protein